MAQTNPTHPGELLQQMLADKGKTQTDLSRDLLISFRTVNEICRGKRRITQKTAIKLATYFDNITDAKFWCQKQLDYDVTEGKQDA